MSIRLLSQRIKNKRGFFLAYFLFLVAHPVHGIEAVG